MVMNFLKKQFVDVIEWDWQDDDVLMWRYPMQDNEIQNGASLTVRDGQIALFINEGQVADVFEAGRYTLTTQTLPLITNLKNWDKAFASPFKSDVLFFNVRTLQGKKWGTAQPVTVRDSDFGMVQIRAFGMYSYSIEDVAGFYKNITGIDANYGCEQIEPQLRNLINANLAASLGQSDVPFIDLAANQIKMGEEIQKTLRLDFHKMGLKLEAIVVENVSLPAKLQEALDKRMAMGVIGDMNTYTQYQSAESISLAAQNEGGMAGMGASLGVGMQMGQVMANAFAQPQQMQQQQMQQPVSSPQPDFNAKLTQLKGLLDQGLITQADYDAAKSEVIAQLTQ